MIRAGDAKVKPMLKDITIAVVNLIGKYIMDNSGGGQREKCTEVEMRVYELESWISATWQTDQMTSLLARIYRRYPREQAFIRYFGM